MSSKFYAARWIVPMTSSIIENGCIEVAGDAIVAIHSELPVGVEFVELGDVAEPVRLREVHHDGLFQRARRFGASKELGDGARCDW